MAETARCSLRSARAQAAQSISRIALQKRLVAFAICDGLNAQMQAIEAEDTPSIVAAQEAAGQIARLLEDALRTGVITAEGLFDEQYQPIRLRSAVGTLGGQPTVQRRRPRGR